MKKKNNILKRIFFIVLFVVLLPVVLIVLLFRAISLKIRYNLYKKNRLSGRVLIMSTSIDDLEHMLDFELIDFFKYFNFYRGYHTSETQVSGRAYNLKLNIGTNLFLMKYAVSKKVNHKTNLKRLSNSMEQMKIHNGIYITTQPISVDLVQLASARAIEVIDKSQLELKLAEVRNRIEKDARINGYDIERPLHELIDEMYPNRI